MKLGMIDSYLALFIRILFINIKYQRVTHNMSICNNDIKNKKKKHDPHHP